jgi:hypothetical protein
LQDAAVTPGDARAGGPVSSGLALLLEDGAGQTVLPARGPPTCPDGIRGGTCLAFALPGSNCA